jgi:exopolysaccharide production protein ExoZ
MMNQQKQSRIETLDWLRGLMALSIMYYHLTHWFFFHTDASNPLGRLGVYGVSIFFLLSGLSMAIVYNRYISSLKSSLNFFVRRIFRIWPLYWIVCILAIAPEVFKTGSFDGALFFLNVSTLFGFVSPGAYIPTGAWSIGNEMVYYAMTPFIFMLYNYRRWAGNLFFLISLAVGGLFAFYLLDSRTDIGPQWHTYINPFNNLFLYVMGIAIYYNFRQINIPTLLNLALLLMAVSLFCFYPSMGM